MFFTLAQVVVGHTLPEGGPMHFHLWHVALIAGILLCGLLLAGVGLLDLRKALEEERQKREKAEREASRRKEAGERLRSQIGMMGAEFTALSEELPKLDPRLRAAAIMIGRQGRKLTLVSRLVAEVAEARRKDVAKLDEERRRLAEVHAYNTKNARALADAHGTMRTRERAIAEQEQTVHEVNEAQRQNAERLMAATEDNARTRAALEDGVRKLADAQDGAPAEHTGSDDKKTLH